MLGQRVCHMHGGKSPQALAKAEDRMRALIDPAISSLSRQIENDEFPAVKLVLEWAGFKATEKIQQEGTLEIVFDRHPTPRALGGSNGTSPT